MNSVLENTYAWTGSFVEAFSQLACDVTTLIYTSLGITSNTSLGDGSSRSGSESSSSSSSNSNSGPVASGEKTLSIIPQVLQEAASLFAFDDFQFLLLKIFVSIIFCNVCLIYIAWYFYGTKITERFMSPNTSPEELKRGVSNLKLPREHSQRYA